MNTENIAAIVYALNLELLDYISDNERYEHGIYFEYLTDGFVEVIELCKNQIWCSEDDSRIYDDEKDEYEPLEDYLRKQFNKFVSVINKIKL